MARTRKAASGKTGTPTNKQISGGGDALTCPECGKTFTRPASLGAHRNRAHGVVGASKRRAGRSSRSRSGGATRRRGSTQATRQQATRTRSRSSSSDVSRGGGVNRDQLLQTLFPNGVPAREAVIRRANAWLDEAERLAGTK